MDGTFERLIDFDFHIRERARTDEFTPIWRDALDAVFADVAPYYDIASDVASLGLCSLWRRRFVASIETKPGDAVLDVCAGTNGVGIALLDRQPDLRVSAIDRSAAMQEVGRRRARERGHNIDSVIQDVHTLPFPDRSFDVVTLQYASRHLRVVDVFTEIHRVLRPGGSFYHCDMLRPENPVVATLYGIYLKACVSGTALAFGSGEEAWGCRDYFVRAIELFYSSAELTEMLKRIGFAEVTANNAPGGVVAWHRAIRKA